ncbi:hypothetical protein ABIA10_000052 [Rhizobium leguminosarum]
MARQPRPRLTLDIAAIPTYAIGDIHGRYDLLVKAEAAILRDGGQLPGRKLIVTLGDYIDRGPESSQVIDHLMEPPPGWIRPHLPCRQSRSRHARLYRRLDLL